jgi:hypothetical protein
MQECCALLRRNKTDNSNSFETAIGIYLFLGIFFPTRECRLVKLREWPLRLVAAAVWFSAGASSPPYTADYPTDPIGREAPSPHLNIGLLYWVLQGRARS